MVNISPQSDKVEEGHKQVRLIETEFCSEQNAQERKDKLFFTIRVHPISNSPFEVHLTPKRNYESKTVQKSKENSKVQTTFCNLKQTTFLV